jgi:hypothetical protein
MSARIRWARLSGALAFAVTPWATLGLGTAVAFALVALLFGRLSRVHAVVLWSSAVVYAVALVGAIALSDTTEGSTGDVVFTTCLLVGMVVGGLEALVLTVVALASGYRAAPPWNRVHTSSTDPAAPVAAVDPLHRLAHRRQGDSSRVGRVVGVVSLVVYVGFLTPVVVVGLLGDLSFRNHHAESRATVVSVREDTSCTGYPVPSCTDQYYPTVVFTPVGGGTVQAETGDFRGDSGAGIATGDRIIVHYDPDDPRDVRLGTGWDSQDTVVVALTVFTYVMIAIVVRQKRRRRPPPPTRMPAL